MPLRPPRARRSPPRCRWQVLGSGSGPHVPWHAGAEPAAADQPPPPSALAGGRSRELRSGRAEAARERDAAGGEDRRSSSQTLLDIVIWLWSRACRMPLNWTRGPRARAAARYGAVSTADRHVASEVAG